MKIKSFLKKNNLTYRNYITSNNSNNNIMYYPQGNINNHCYI